MPLADFAKRAPPARTARTVRRTQPRRPPSPGGSPSRGELAGAGESGARAPQGPGPAHSCGVSRESRQRQWRVAPWRREPREGRRPAGPGIYLPHQRRAATLARCSRASLSGCRRLEGPAREGAPGRLPSGGEGRGGSAKPREDAAWGWGDPAGTKAPGFLWLRRHRPSSSPDPDPGGAGPRGRRGSPLWFLTNGAGKGGRGYERREFLLHARLQGSEDGDWSGGSWSRYSWGKLPRDRRFQGPVFSLEVKGHSCW